VCVQAQLAEGRQFNATSGALGATLAAYASDLDSARAALQARPPLINHTKHTHYICIYVYMYVYMYIYICMYICFTCQ
jgi:hypothetical protein